MYEVYRNHDSSKVGLIDNILKEAGIATVLRNWTGSNITEIPIPSMYPNTCVMNECDLPIAKQIVEEYFNAEVVARPEWVCSECESVVDGFLSECWSCQTPMKPKA